MRHYPASGTVATAKANRAEFLSTSPQSPRGRFSLKSGCLAVGSNGQIRKTTPFSSHSAEGRGLDQVRAHQHGLIISPLLSGSRPAIIELALLHLANGGEPYGLAALP